MKKLLFILLAVFIALNISAENGGRSTVITTKDLPSNSQSFISKNFKSLSSVISTLKWSDNYGVYLKNGEKLNFYLDGSLKEAKTTDKPLPKSILAGLPSGVNSFIKSNYKDWNLTELEVKNNKIEVKLIRNNLKAKLEFDRAGNLLKNKIKD